MRYICIFLIGMFFLGGCVGAKRQGADIDGFIEPTVVFNSADSGFILSCLDELASVGGKEFDDWFAEAEAQMLEGSDEDKLRFICLSLHSEASYGQFKKGIALLEEYTVEHSRDRQAMEGLLGLVNRLDKTKISRWSIRKKLLDEKEELESEVDTLKGELQHGRIKIKELQNQIEQLKNIENIMRSREHGS